MSLQESVSRSASREPTAIRCSSSALSLQHKLLGIVRSLRPTGHRKWLQGVTKRSARTVDYWLSGDTAMGGDAFAAVVCALRKDIDAQSSELRQFELDFGFAPAP